MSTQSVIRATDFSLAYRLGRHWVKVLQDIHLSIEPLEIHGIVGESGSGKSTLALALMGVLAPNARIDSGEILFGEQNLCTLARPQLRQIWGRHISLVPQNPLDSLNPSLSIGAQINEVALLHLTQDPRHATELSLQALQRVQLPDPARLLGRYPHQLSGGQLQRVLIAMALLPRPRLLILDEPTSALDVTTAVTILDLVRELVREEGSSALFVSHDLNSVARLCDRVSVLYAGEIVASAPTKHLFSNPIHPYTHGLLGSIPRRSAGARMASIMGRAPALSERPPACVFAPRCAVAEARCHAEKPRLEGVDEERQVRCWRWREIMAGELEAALYPAPARLPQRSPADDTPILAVRGLRKQFGERSLWDRLRRRPAQPVRALEPASFHLNRRSTVGIVGESGSGKTTLARAIVALTPADSGELELLSHGLPLELHQRQAAQLRELQMVFQNPNDSLNPFQTVEQAISRALIKLNQSALNAQQRRARVLELLESVGLSASYADRTPDQLSGGEKQRVAIARAFAASPALVLADEPTSSLDVSVQAVILNLLKDLREQAGASYLIISHDLEVIASVADWVLVMYLGDIVEQGTTEQVYAVPRHPYTEALLSAHASEQSSPMRLSEDAPSPRHKPSGCPFHPRCPRYLGDICHSTPPPLQTSTDGHMIRCHIPIDELRRLQSSATSPQET